MARFDYRQSETPPAVQPAGAWSARPHFPYILPFFAYLLIMFPSAFGHFAGVDWTALWKTYQPLLYPLKTVLAAVLLWALWPYYSRISWRRLPVGAAVGVVGTFLWIGSEWLCQRIGLAPGPDPSKLYNPDQMLASGWPLVTYLCLRVVGPSLVVPVMEELFFRDFVQRTLVRINFQEVPIGTFTWTSLLGMSVLFGINHGFEFFIPGVLYGLLMGVLLIRTKSLGACIVAHGVTNWTLYLYVIYTGNWQFM